jgi:hypothetical protein
MSRPKLKMQILAMPDHVKPQNPSTPTGPVAPKPVKFIHEKGPQYRIYHADAGWGVINQFGNVQIDFCVEHPPTPSHVVQPIDAKGVPQGEYTMFGLDDKDHFLIVRDFQCGVVLSFAAAVQVHTILGHYINTAKQNMDMAIAQMKSKQ